MNITFDLETLGNTFQAPIVQIGAVKFTDQGEIKDTFLRNIDLFSLNKYKDFNVDYSTLSWWFNQPDEAIKSVFGENLSVISLSNALYDFIKWIGQLSDYVYWSHTTFDPVILNYNFKVIDRINPIPFRLHRDIRTLTYFAGEINIKREGIHHNALDDCIYQASYITKGLEQILKNTRA